jgi:thiol-disulfide isomerase/thioredoxin
MGSISEEGLRMTLHRCRAVLRVLAVFSSFFVAGSSPAGAVEPSIPGAPTDPKAVRTFTDGMNWQKQGQKTLALDAYRKANQQDGGHCAACLSRGLKLAQDLGDYKAQEGILHDWISLAQSDRDKANLHFQLGIAPERQGIAENGGKKGARFNESCDEFKTALELDPKMAVAHYAMGVSLAYLHQDDAARAEFKTYLSEDTETPTRHERAARFIDHMDLARARMAPPFDLTTLDGRHITMDSLAGKVVLIDFWATWCGPCREALPHMRQIAQRFQGQPIVILSVSLDDDEAKWKDFVAKNGMTWLQYRDGGFTGPIATSFAVRAIPATFSIDADGVLEDQHVGDADIEGKLKKMIAHAAEMQTKQAAPTAPAPSSGSGN